MSYNTPPPPPPLLVRSQTMSNSFSALGDSDNERDGTHPVFPLSPIHLPLIEGAERWADSVVAVSPIPSGNTRLTRLTNQDTSWKTIESRSTRRKRRKAERKKRQEEEQEMEDAALSESSPLERDDAVAGDPRSPTVYHHAFGYVEEQSAVSG